MVVREVSCRVHGSRNYKPMKLGDHDVPSCFLLFDIFSCEKDAAQCVLGLRCVVTLEVFMSVTISL